VLLQPRITSDRPNNPTVHMQADTGNVTSDAERVFLVGNVKITRAASTDNPELRATGKSLVVLPEQDIAQSDEPFEVQHGGSHIWSQTMLFNNTDRTIKMNDNVHARGEAIFEAQKKTAPSAAGPTGTR
jgi:LPS export ABC transporter protein LptC